MHCGGEPSTGISTQMNSPEPVPFSWQPCSLNDRSLLSAELGVQVRESHSRTTRRESLSFRSAMNLACRRYPLTCPVDELEPPNKHGFQQRQSAILFAVSPAPHRPLRASGRFAKGQIGVSSSLKRLNNCARVAVVGQFDFQSLCNANLTLPNPAKSRPLVRLSRQ
jgi:hypothetical protein